MARNEIEARVQDLNDAAARLTDAIQNCNNAEERGLLFMGLNVLNRQLVKYAGVPGERNCSPLIGAQIGEYKICTFMGSKFYRETFGFDTQQIYQYSASNKHRKVFVRRTLEANEAKPNSNTQYVYLLRCASDATLGVYQSAFSICKKLSILGPNQKRTTFVSRLGSTYATDYSVKVLENLIDIGAAEKNEAGLYRLI